VETVTIMMKRKKLKARTLAAIKAYSFLPIIFISEQLHSNNKIRLYKTLIKPVLFYRSVTWNLTQMIQQMLCTSQRKILRRIYVQYKIKDAGVLDGIVKFIICTKMRGSQKTSLMTSFVIQDKWGNKEQDERTSSGGTNSKFKNVVAIS
jgi:hypothetical protein